MIWDNVRYHHSRLVRTEAVQLGIELRFLPPYSPDLMPVERLWSWLRQELTYLHCHPSEQQLAERIAAFVAQLLDEPATVPKRLRPKRLRLKLWYIPPRNRKIPSAVEKRGVWGELNFCG